MPPQWLQDALNALAWLLLRPFLPNMALSYISRPVSWEYTLCSRHTDWPSSLGPCGHLWPFTETLSGFLYAFLPIGLSLWLKLPVVSLARLSAYERSICATFTASSTLRTSCLPASHLPLRRIGSYCAGLINIYLVCPSVMMTVTLITYIFRCLTLLIIQHLWICHVT